MYVDDNGGKVMDFLIENESMRYYVIRNCMMNQLRWTRQRVSLSSSTFDYDMTPPIRFGLETARRWKMIRAIRTSASVARSRDVMAKYRRPPPLPTFETASTVPAAASFQDVPPPTTTIHHVRKAVPIPAMIPTPENEPQQQTKEMDKEMIVQGVVIPAKPTPPKDDGMSTYLFFPSSMK